MDVLAGIASGEVSPAFGIILVFLLGVFLFVTLRVLFVPGSQARVDHDRMNIELSRAELAQLKESRQLGLIDDNEFADARDSVERSLAHNLSNSSSGAGSDQRTRPGWLNAALAMVLIPLVVIPALLLYSKIGEHRALNSDFVAANMPGAEGQSTSANNASADVSSEKLPSIEELLPRLETHLQTNPDDASGWTLLGTTYLRLRRFTDAENALQEAYRLMPENPDVMLQLADAKAMQADGLMAGEPVRLVDLALQKVPDDVRALWLKGMASSQAGDHSDAIDRWRRLQPLLAGDAEASERVNSLIAEASSKLSSSADTASSTSSAVESSKTAAQTATQGLRVRVDLAPSLRADLAESTAVYVYAKASSGPPMPLAVIKKSVADFPIEVVLDDSMAMMPQLKLSAFESVTVGARVSHSGNPVSQPGDFFTETSNVQSTAGKPVDLLIDQQVE